VPDLDLKLGLVEAFYLVVDMLVNSECQAQGREQVLLIEL
jgi:hypothetical protein